MKQGRSALMLALILALLGTISLPVIIKCGPDSLFFSNSVVSLFAFIGLTVLFFKIVKKGFKGSIKLWIFPGILGILFTACMTMGKQLDQKESISLGNLGIWVGFLILSVLITMIIRYLWDLLANHSSTQKIYTSPVPMYHFWLPSIIIFLCYIPVFLATYPGFFVYDAHDEVMQVINGVYNTHHPLAHVLFMGSIINGVKNLTGSYNIGIACYTLIHMAIMAIIFGYCVNVLKKRGLPRIYLIIVTLYFALCPVLVMYSLCSVKDGLFGAMILLLTMSLQDCYKDPVKFFQKKGKLVGFVLIAVCMMLLRHNGFYAFLVAIPFLILFIKKYRIKMLILCVIPILLYLSGSKALEMALHADASENQEMLTVPIMQLARVYTFEKDKLSDADKDELYKYLSLLSLSYYNPKVSDGVKADFNNDVYKQDKGAFFKLWIRWGTRYPAVYLNAWLMTSYGFWYPDTVIDVYKGNEMFTFSYGDSSYFGFEVEDPGVRESKFPWLLEQYRKMSLEITQQKIPVVSMLFSPGFLLWITLFFLGFFCYIKKYKKVVPFFIPLLCFITYLLGPTYLVRYVIYWWMLLPVLISELYVNSTSDSE